MEDSPLRPSRLKLCKDVGNFLLEQWLLIAIGVVIVLAYYFPDVGKTGGIVKSQYTVTYGAVAVIFLVSGLTLPTERLLLHILNWRLHIIVQVTSFLLVSACFFGVTAAISSAGNSSIQTAALVGLVITGCLPTTISSNVVMTKAAGGDDAATMVEVTIGNLLGPFITPLLISRLYLPAIGAFASLSPASDNATLRPLYARVMKQMGLSVFLPLAVGQLVQFIWPKKTKDICTRFKIAKLGSLGLLCIIWSTFCSAFASGSLQTMPTPTIVLMVFLNVILCGAFSLFSFFLARPPRALNRRYPTLFHIMDKRETIAVVFCAPAKTQAMGVPLVQAMYASSSEATRASLQVPIVLYTVEGILIAQVLVAIFKRWLAVEAEKGVESVMTSSIGVSHLEENKGEQRPAESLDDKEAK